MINYNPKDWFTFIFRFHKSDTFRELFPLMVALAIYCLLVSWVEIGFLKLSENSRMKNLSIMHTMLTFVISMLLVFRTNTAYERWWEGRKLWGALVNSSRSLAFKVSILIPKDDNLSRITIANLLSAYAKSLQVHLSDSDVYEDIVRGDLCFVGGGKSEQHQPNLVLKALINTLYTLRNSGKLTDCDLFMLNNELTGFADICGGCERIKLTPIPFSYSVFLKKFIFFFVMTLPITLVFSLGYFCVPVVLFIFYVLTSIELIAEEIEDPFGGDSNDLPLLSIANKIEQSVFDIFNILR